MGRLGGGGVIAMSSRLHNLAVCIDERMIQAAATGVATYARSLRDALPLVTNRPFLLSDTSSPACDEGLRRHSRIMRFRRLIKAAWPTGRNARLLVDPQKGHWGRVAVPDVFRLAQVHFNLYGRLLSVRPPLAGGLMHWTYPVPLRMEGWINVYTVHDAIPLTQPELSPINAERHRRMLDRIVASSDMLVTVSEAARAEIISALGCSPDKVRNCSQPVDVGPSPGPPPMNLQSRRYLLVCGSVEPRKNIARIVEACKQSGVDIPLVVAGPDGWRAEEITASFKATKGVLRLPYCKREDMLALIAHARALVMPSLAEGFGLPVAEAMASGTAVITSDRGALAEIAGGAAFLVDPNDVHAIASAIGRLCCDDALHARLVHAGRERAAAFGKSRFADNLAIVYTELIAPSVA